MSYEKAKYIYKEMNCKIYITKREDKNEEV